MGNKYKFSFVEGTRFRESFNSDIDIWFDPLSDASEKYFEGGGYPKFEMLDELAMQIQQKKLKPTQKGFDVLKQAISKLPSTDPAYKALQSMFLTITPQSYKKEFKKWEGEHSVLSELFSLFRQAVEYYATGGEE